MKTKTDVSKFKKHIQKDSGDFGQKQQCDLELTSLISHQITSVHYYEVQTSSTVESDTSEAVTV